MTGSAGHRLLVVEDDPEIRYLLSVILDADDREVLTVTSGDEAAELLGNGGFDLVVLDLILPDVDGRTLLTRIRESAATAAIPVLVVSAQVGQEVRKDCYDLGADYFTEKPFEPDEFAAEVTRHLERTEGVGRTALEDPVTGLLNPAGLVEAAAANRSGYALALLQIDGFVSISERWGWASAEKTLWDVARSIRGAVGADLPLARLGGGEFAFLVSDEVMKDAQSVAEQALLAVRELRVKDPSGETLRLTASIGVADADAGTALEEAVASARPRVFKARELGGNQVVHGDARPDEREPLRILVAEDDEISATILVHRLEREGLQVTRFENGREAYEGALKVTPNLVILDVKMPGMDGFEVLERLRRSPAYADVPIILLTSMGSEADVVRGFQLGADDYILKPFSPVELSARVWRLLRRGRSATAI